MVRFGGCSYRCVLELGYCGLVLFLGRVGAQPVIDTSNMPVVTDAIVYRVNEYAPANLWTASGPGWQVWRFDTVPTNLLDTFGYLSPDATLWSDSFSGAEYVIPTPFLNTTLYAYIDRDTVALDTIVDTVMGYAGYLPALGHFRTQTLKGDTMLYVPVTYGNTLSSHGIYRVVRNDTVVLFQSWRWDTADARGYVYVSATDSFRVLRVRGKYVNCLDAWIGGVPVLSDCDTFYRAMFVTDSPGIRYPVALLFYFPADNQYELRVMQMYNPAPQANFQAVRTDVLVNEEVSFINLSTGASSFLWDFGDGQTSTVHEPIHRYSVPDTYTVRLIAFRDTLSDTLTRVDYIRVWRKPIASFRYTISGLTVSFINESQYATSYFWDFGDNQTSTEVNPTHTYTMSGPYIVQLRAMNPGGSDDTLQVLILTGEEGDVDESNGLVYVGLVDVDGLWLVAKEPMRAVVVYDGGGRVLCRWKGSSQVVQMLCTGAGRVGVIWVEVEMRSGVRVVRRVGF